MNEKFNENAKVQQLTKMVRKGVWKGILPLARVHRKMSDSDPYKSLLCTAHIKAGKKYINRQPQFNYGCKTIFFVHIHVPGT